jgi:hypothetical protein
MFDINSQTATAAVDEAAKTIVPQLNQSLQLAVEKLLAGLSELLKGRVITITIQ